MSVDEASKQGLPVAPLLPGKFFRPPLRPELVDRPRLFERLQEGWQNGRPLTLVVAPAGYGKSTLVAAWAHDLAQRDNVAVAWLTLDKSDNDPGRFFTYLTASLGAALPGAGEAMRGLLASLPWLVPESVAATLLADLPPLLERNEGPPLELLLVLDDYHHLQTSALHETVRLLAENQLPALHLALVTRQDPALPLSRWRVRDQMTEIRARDLRFTEEEAARFLQPLQTRLGQPLQQQWVATLTQRTEGWAAGLQLAALALRGSLARSAQDAASFVDNFSGGHRYVIDYLVEEVLAQLEPAMRRFLTGTAVLERLCAPLCAAVLAADPAGQAEAEAQAMLERLEAANLFLIPMDGCRRWYRYHQLFADCLRIELDPAQRAEGQRRAAAWFARQDLYPEAIDYAAAAGATSEVARLARLAAEPTFQKGRIVRVAGSDELLSAAPSQPQTGEDATSETASHAPETVEALTNQERTVLRLLMSGHSNLELAEELVITVGTAKWHVHNIYQKLNVGSRPKAIARAHEWQLVDL